jgi:hypothetical protein
MLVREKSLSRVDVVVTLSQIMPLYPLLSTVLRLQLGNRSLHTTSSSLVSCPSFLYVIISVQHTLESLLNVWREQPRQWKSTPVTPVSLIELRMQADSEKIERFHNTKLCISAVHHEPHIHMLACDHLKHPAPHTSIQTATKTKQEQKSMIVKTKEMTMVV